MQVNITLFSDKKQGALIRAWAFIRNKELVNESSGNFYHILYLSEM